MFLKSLTRVLDNLSSKVPLRNILVIPFVLQIFGAVGLVGYLSFLNGQRTVDILVEELEREVSKNIEQHLEKYSIPPKLANQGFISALKAGLDPQDFESVQRYFWEYVRTTEDINTLQFGYAQGQYLGAGRDSDGFLVFKTATQKTGKDEYNFDIYNTDEQGNQTTLIDTRPGYNLKKRDWYQKTVEAGETRWSPIYKMFSHQSLGMTLSEPVYDQNDRLIGVVGTDILLKEVSEFLRKIITDHNEPRLKNGHIFIIERSGNLVASSSVSSKEQYSQRVKATESKDPLIQWAARYLKEKIESWNNIQREHQAKEYHQGHKGKGQFIRVSPFQDKYGLDWLIVIVLPEQNFIEPIMEPIYQHNLNLVILCCSAVVIAIITGSLTTRQITRPLSQLNQAATALSQGKWSQAIPETRQQEVGQLAQTFEQMRRQLKKSFTKLEISKAKLESSRSQLETQVSQRTAALITANRLLRKDSLARKKAEEALREKEAYLRLILDNIPQQVFWKDINLVFQGCNKNWAVATGFENPEEIVGKTDYDLIANSEDAEVYRDQDRLLINEELQELNFIEQKEKSRDLDPKIWLDVRKIPIHNEVGEIIGILGVVEDITSSRQNEIDLWTEKTNSERLLRNIFPQTIAAQLKDRITNPRDEDEDYYAIAENFDQVTILFADIVGFTPLSSRLSPRKLVDLLNKIFTTFDDLAEYLELEKIKTIGDAYMVAAGLPEPNPDHAIMMADMALTMQAVIEHLQYEEDPLQIRVGIHSGSVIAGVIGIRKFSYDLWGDTVNIASRMESSGEPGKIQVTETLYEQLKDDYILEKRGEIQVKGKGEMTTYWLKGRKDD